MKHIFYTNLEKCEGLTTRICHCGAGLAATGRFRDIRQNVPQSTFQTEVDSVPVTSRFPSHRLL